MFHEGEVIRVGAHVVAYVVACGVVGDIYGRSARDELWSEKVREQIFTGLRYEGVWELEGIGHFSD